MSYRNPKLCPQGFEISSQPYTVWSLDQDSGLASHERTVVIVIEMNLIDHLNSASLAL